MTYRRVIERNHLEGDYPNLLAGDLRRLEQDQRDALHLARYAQGSGATSEQVRQILDIFFGDKHVDTASGHDADRNPVADEPFHRSL